MLYIISVILDFFSSLCLQEFFPLSGHVLATRVPPHGKGILADLNLPVFEEGQQDNVSIREQFDFIFATGYTCAYIFEFCTNASFVIIFIP